VDKLRVLIVGAGISGLALAKALLDRGFLVDVVERRADDGRALGSGLYLPANAVRALQGIGVGGEVAKRAEPVARQRLHDHRGRPLAEFEVELIWGGVGPCWRSPVTICARCCARLSPALSSATTPK
jgi:2-polyprenyl-6-methoxyphenol hydroxylase-like FAD-dependent oxidoreductase